MNKVLCSFALAMALAGCSKPSNFAECIIKDMNDVHNPQVFVAIYQSCAADFPALYRDIEQGSGQSLFSYKDRESCVLDNAKDTTFQKASGNISVACGCLYDEPSYQGQTCEQYFLR